jgi:hypothetical protein
LDRATAHEFVDPVAGGDGERLVGRAVPAEFGCIDADEAYLASVGKPQAVAVLGAQHAYRRGVAGNDRLRRE